MISAKAQDLDFWSALCVSPYITIMFTLDVCVCATVSKCAQTLKGFIPPPGGTQGAFCCPEAAVKRYPLPTPLPVFDSG